MIRKLLTILLLVTNQYVSAQNIVSDSLQKQFSEYSIRHLQEKLFIHTDRQFYMAGELAWFKIYTADGVMQKPLDLSKIVYAELLSSDQKPVLQLKISMSGGMGSGTFMIPYSINSGSYTLRAYTSLMKNYSTDYFFEKQLTIINTLKKPVWSKQDTTVKLDIQFFPEGGNLVSGIENNVGLKISDKTGKGVDATGSIINGQNDTVCRFKTFLFGMGHFFFQPKSDEKYKAIVRTNGSQIQIADLPDASDNGYAIHLISISNEKLKLTVSTKKPVSETLYLLIQTRQVFKKILSTTSNNGVAEFLIDKNILGEGISKLTLFNSIKMPLAERVWFNQRIEKLLVKAFTGEIDFKARKEVHLNVQTTDITNTPVPANLSIAVVQDDSLQAPDDSHILSYLWLSADLKGFIEQPDFYFRNSSAIVDEAADNLMLTQGWRKFEWSEVFNKETSSLQYMPEADGHIVSGTVTNKKTGEAVSNTNVYISFPGRSFKTANALSNSSGHLYFDAGPSFGSTEMIVQPNPADTNYTVDISNPFSEKYAARFTSAINLLPAMQGRLVNRSISMQVQHVFAGDENSKYYLNKEYDTSAFYGKSAATYFLDDYTRFTTMEEVIREYVKEVKLRKSRDNYLLDVKSNTAESGFVADPLVMLDGVPVHDMNKLIAFDPLKIKRIDVVTDKYYSNSQITNGIISLTTYEGDLAGFNLDASATILEYDGMQLERKFYSPAYTTREQIESRIPDFRTLLFWKPYFITDSGGKGEASFFTSDIPGKYLIVIQGMSPTGLSGYTLSSITVK